MRLSGGIDMLLCNHEGQRGERICQSFETAPILSIENEQMWVYVFLIHRNFRCTIVSPCLGLLPIYSVAPHVSCTAFPVAIVSGSPFRRFHRRCVHEPCRKSCTVTHAHPSYPPIKYRHASTLKGLHSGI